MLTAELGAGEQIRTVPGETVARAKTELALPDADALAPATLTRVGSVLGTDVVILGSFFVSSADPSAPLRVDLRLQEVSGHALDAVISETGTPEQVLTLVSSLGRKLRDRLGVTPPSAEQVETVRSAFPESAEAPRLYAEGLSKLRRFDLVEARKLLSEAADTAPKNPLIRSALASCYTALGDDAHAKEAAQAAFDLSGSLSREERLFMEAQLAEAKKEWAKAIEDYRALFRFFPDDVEHALRLAGAQTASGHATDALAVLSEAAKLGIDPRVALAQGSAEMALSRYKAALADARRSVEAGTKSGARLLVAQGHMLEGDALLRLGDHKGASLALESARKLFAETGDRNAEARVVNRLANVAFEEGDYARARDGFEAAAGTWHKVGNAAGEVKALHNVADAHEMEGDLAAARPLFDRVIATAAAIGDKAQESAARSNLAYLLLLQGDPRSAEGNVRAGIAQAKESGAGYQLLIGLYVSGRISTESGDLERARETYMEALTVAGQIGEQRFAAYSEQGLGEVARAAGAVDEARRRLLQALTVRRTLEGRSEMAETLTTLGAVAVDQGKLAEARTYLSEALTTCARISLRDSELAAQSERLRMATRMADPSERSAAAAKVRDLSGRTQNVLLRLGAALALADLDPQRAAAIRQVEEEARARGLLLIARRASDALR
jgi:tetratricopeptide (TPR) repeat protein